MAYPLIQGLGSVFAYLRINVFTLFQSIVDSALSVVDL
jgi:hypothetical protein